MFLLGRKLCSSISRELWCTQGLGYVRPQSRRREETFIIIVMNSEFSTVRFSTVVLGGSGGLSKSVCSRTCSYHPPNPLQNIESLLFWDAWKTEGRYGCTCAPDDYYRNSHSTSTTLIPILLVGLLAWYTPPHHHHLSSYFCSITITTTAITINISTRRIAFRCLCGGERIIISIGISLQFIYFYFPTVI